MKNKRNKVLIGVIVVLAIWILFFSGDGLRSKNNKLPFFSFQTGAYDDGGSVRHNGLFYNVYKLHYFNAEMNEEWENEDGTIKYEYKDREYITGVKIAP